MEYLWVGVGGGVGAAARYGVARLATGAPGSAFPYATFLVNLSGSFAIGVVLTLLTARVADPVWRLLLVTGFLGGYTTFSAFTFETVALLQDDRWGRAVLYVVGSNLLGLLACWGGVLAVRGVTR